MLFRLRASESVPNVCGVRYEPVVLLQYYCKLLLVVSRKALLLVITSSF
jgi:hypothetical protein